MDFFKRLGAGAAGAAARFSTEQAHAQTLLARIESSALLEDKKRAIEELQEHLQKFPSVVLGAGGNATLVGFLKTQKERKEDAEVVRAAVQTLLASMTSQGENGERSVDVAAISTYAQTNQHVTALLDVLEDNDLYLRYYTIQLLTVLLMNKSEKVQAVVLAYPMGVNILLQMLDDRRDIIRNEILLLLEALTQNNVAIQKIVAFNGAFDKLLGIAHEEGMLDGGIIVEDCLRLINNLLKDNASNQTLFADMGCLKYLTRLLRMPAELKPLNDSQLDILSLSLDVGKHLISSFDAKAAASSSSSGSGSASTSAAPSLQAQSRLAPLIAPVVDLSASPLLPLALRLDCLSLLAAIVDGHAKNQSVLARHSVPAQFAVASSGSGSSGSSKKGKEQPALNHILHLALHAGDLHESALAEFVLRCYFRGNSEGQLTATATFTPLPEMPAAGGFRGAGAGAGAGTGAGAGAGGPPGGLSAMDSSMEEKDDGPPPGVGRLLLAALRSDEHLRVKAKPGSDLLVDRRWLAARIIALLLRDNTDCKVFLLNLPVEIPHTSAPPARLIDVYLDTLFATKSQPTQSGMLELSLLTLLCEWVHQCPQVVDMVFTKQYFLPYLISLTSPLVPSPLIRGLATLVIALSLELAVTYEEQQKAKAAAAAAAAAASRESKQRDRDQGAAPLSLSPGVLLEVITKQVGLDKFKANLDLLRFSVEFDSADKLVSLRDANPLTFFAKLAEDEKERQAAEISLKESKEVLQSGAPASAASAAAAAAATAAALVLKQPRSSFAVPLFDHHFTSQFKRVHDTFEKRMLALLTTAATAMAAGAAGAGAGTGAGGSQLGAASAVVGGASSLTVGAPGGGGSGGAFRPSSPIGVGGSPMSVSSLSTPGGSVGLSPGSSGLSASVSMQSVSMAAPAALLTELGQTREALAAEQRRSLALQHELQQAAAQATALVQANQQLRAELEQSKAQGAMARDAVSRERDKEKEHQFSAHVQMLTNELDNQSKRGQMMAAEIGRLQQELQTAQLLHQTNNSLQAQLGLAQKSKQQLDATIGVKDDQIAQLTRQLRSFEEAMSTTGAVTGAGSTGGDWEARYKELHAEHEDLLILLAQQELERESLMQSLAKTGTAAGSHSQQAAFAQSAGPFWGGSSGLSQGKEADPPARQPAAPVAAASSGSKSAPPAGSQAGLASASAALSQLGTQLAQPPQRAAAVAPAPAAAAAVAASPAGKGYSDGSGGKSPMLKSSAPAATFPPGVGGLSPLQPQPAAAAKPAPVAVAPMGHASSAVGLAARSALVASSASFPAAFALPAASQLQPQSQLQPRAQSQPQHQPQPQPQVPAAAAAASSTFASSGGGSGGAEVPHDYFGDSSGGGDGVFTYDDDAETVLGGSNSTWRPDGTEERSSHALYFTPSGSDELP